MGFHLISMDFAKAVQVTLALVLRNQFWENKEYELELRSMYGSNKASHCNDPDKLLQKLEKDRHAWDTFAMVSVILLRLSKFWLISTMSRLPNGGFTGICSWSTPLQSLRQ